MSFHSSQKKRKFISINNMPRRTPVKAGGRGFSLGGSSVKAEKISVEDSFLEEKLKEEEEQAEAFQLLTDPFPVPDHHLISVTVPDNGSIGIGLGDYYVDGADDKKINLPRSVWITQLHDNNAFEGTPLQLGQQLMAVDGRSVVTAFQTGNMMRKEPNESLTIHTSEPVAAPFCKFFAVNLSQLSPGVNFDSARSRSLVQVSHIYQQRMSPFLGRLKERDIILAIDGTPVSTPECADQALRQARQSLFTIVYAVDTMELCRSIAQRAKATNPDWKQLALVPTSSSSDENSDPTKASPLRKMSHHKQSSNSKSNGLLSLVYQSDDSKDDGSGQSLVSALVLDKETMLLKDTFPPPLAIVMLKKGKAVDARYYSIVQPFLQKFNELLEETLTELSESVGCAVWQHHGSSVAKSGENQQQQQRSSSSVLHHRTNSCPFPTSGRASDAPATTTATAAMEILDYLPVAEAQLVVPTNIHSA